MGIAYRIDKQLGATLVMWANVVTADAFLAHVQRLCADPEWPPPGRLHLCDLRSVSLDASLDDTVVAQAAALYAGQRQKIENMKVAIVAAEAFERAVVFERVLERAGAHVIVFNFLDTARKWLNLAADDVEPALVQLRKQLQGEATQARARTRF